jgi:hypothetical protein
MTYVLVCLLCTGAAGDLGSSSSTVAPPVLQLRAVAPGALAPETLRVDVPSRPSFPEQASDGHSGHDDGARMGPMGIMMGVMMVGMMVVAGAYMMRGHLASPLPSTAMAAPHAAAIPTAVAFRLGG